MRDGTLQQIHGETLRRQRTRDPEPLRYTRTYFSGGTELPVDYYIPDAPVPPEGRPGILFFFGGAFLSGCKEAFAPQAEELAKIGFVAACADYRVKAVHGTGPDESLADGRRAWESFLRAGPEWGMDPYRSVLAGGSAGGQIALCTVRETERPPAAMVLFNPGLGLEEEAAFFTADDLKPGMPPMLILHGAQDQIIPLERVQAFADRAEALRIPVRLEQYPGMGHGFFNLNSSRAHYFLTLGRMILFLNETLHRTSNAPIIP